MGEKGSWVGVSRGHLAAAGFAFIIAVFVLGVYFALTYQRPTVVSLSPEGISVLMGEAMYLLGKLAFLSLALAAGVHLLRIAFSGVEK